MAGWSRCFLGGCFSYADVVNRKLFLFLPSSSHQSTFFLPTRAIIAVSTYDQIPFLLRTVPHEREECAAMLREGSFESNYKIVQIYA